MKRIRTARNTRTPSQHIKIFIWLPMLLGMVFSVQAEQSTGFKPPQLGAPTTRVGGGTRSMEDALEALNATISPKKVAVEPIQLLSSHTTNLSSIASPTLYWYVANIPPYAFELTVQQGKKTVLKKNIGAIKTAGLQTISLADYSVKLAADKSYTWTIAPIGATGIASATATVRYQKPSTSLVGAEQFIQAGYWYDGITQLITSHSPKLPELLQQEGLDINVP